MSGTNKVETKLYSWQAQGPSKKRIKGEMRATNSSSLAIMLRKQGLVLLKYKIVKPKRGRKVTGKEIALFTRQLATLSRTGVPIIRSFELLERSTENPKLGKTISNIQKDISEGMPLSKAIGKYPRLFNQLYCSLVAAGEQAGILDSVLERLAIYQEKTIAIQSKVKSALVYPAAILGVAAIVIAVIMVYVIPAFKEIFANIKGGLPMPTKIIIGISEFFITNLLWIIITPIIVIPYLIKTYLATVAWQHSLDLLLIRLPGLGPIFVKAAIARWTRTFSTMLAAGVPTIQVLSSVGKASGNWRYEKASQEIKARVAEGLGLGICMEATSAFPVMVTQLVAIGEESGALENMLNKVADYYEQEVDEAVSMLSTIIEPVMIAFLGVIVGSIIVAMYMPIFKMGG